MSAEQTEIMSSTLKSVNQHKKPREGASKQQEAQTGNFK